MIARLWSARATAVNAAKYREHFERHVLPSLHGLDGFLSASLLTRATGDEIEIVVLTRWRSFDAIRAFAGADLDRAVVAAEALKMLNAWDDRVRHYDVEVYDEKSWLPPAM